MDNRAFLNECKWSCYCLRSSSNPNRTYVGATVNLQRRIRQHNGEIKGGARSTRMCRPWNVVLEIRGFISKRQTLSFEKKWKIRTRRPGGFIRRLDAALELIGLNDCGLILYKFDHNSIPKKEKTLPLIFPLINKGS